MTITRIVLLTQPPEGAVLGKILTAHNPDLEIALVSDKAALENLLAEDLAATRLLSFCSPVIVPARLLQALPGPSYNFHPGPPDRPGRYPSVFAIYDQAAHYGVTIHEMTDRVDAGPIVAAEWFAVPAGAALADLEALSLEYLVAVFKRLAPFLALNANPLPRIFIPWSGVKRTKADCEAICQLTPGLSETEIALRQRACGSLLR
ncbi:MAG: formyltransferase family protein [Rhodospirillaceae bacterium]